MMGALLYSLRQFGSQSIEILEAHIAQGRNPWQIGRQKTDSFFAIGPTLVVFTRGQCPSHRRVRNHDRHILWERQGPPFKRTTVKTKQTVLLSTGAGELIHDPTIHTHI